MKTTILIIIAAIFLFSCSKDELPHNYRFTAEITGAQSLIATVYYKETNGAIVNAGATAHNAQNGTITFEIPVNAENHTEFRIKIQFDQAQTATVEYQFFDGTQLKDEATINTSTGIFFTTKL